MKLHSCTSCALVLDLNCWRKGSSYIKYQSIFKVPIKERVAFQRWKTLFDIIGMHENLFLEVQSKMPSYYLVSFVILWLICETFSKSVQFSRFDSKIASTWLVQVVPKRADILKEYPTNLQACTRSSMTTISILIPWRILLEIFLDLLRWLLQNLNTDSFKKIQRWFLSEWRKMKRCSTWFYYIGKRRRMSAQYYYVNLLVLFF